MAGGTGIYNTGQINTNRTRRFRVTADAGAGSNVFVFLKGDTSAYPYTSVVASPTANQRIAQERADAIIRSLSRYAPPVKVFIEDVNHGGGETNNALVIEFETEQSMVFAASSGGADIVDTLGKGGESAKTKSGLQTLATALVAGASLDGGSTLLFAANPTLQDGTTSTAAAVTTLTVLDQGI